MDHQQFPRFIISVEKFLKQFPKPSETTSHQYHRACKRMKKDNATPLEMGATRKNSFYFYRAALIYGILREIRLIHSMAVFSYGMGEQQLAIRSAEKIQELVKSLDEYAPDPKRQRKHSGQVGVWVAHAKANGITMQSLSKRRVLSNLSEDWRDDMWKAAQKCKYLDAIAVLGCSGCRPIELQSGIKVEKTPDGILFTITGAKTHQGKFGQKERSVLISVDSPEAQHLNKKLAAHGSPLIVTAKAALLKDAVARISKKLWPRRKVHVTPYVYRHQFSADIKADELSASQVAQALGHAVEESQRFYGHRRQARRGGNRILGVKATHAIRPRRRVYRGPGGNLPKRRSP
ncbi:MAG: hypothetical protein Q8L39_13880 [Burkholderiales bacterium]|nr:hypothetical protein [Burkholderiales bacterium]